MKFSSLILSFCIFSNAYAMEQQPSRVWDLPASDSHCSLSDESYSRTAQTLFLQACSYEKLKEKALLFRHAIIYGENGSGKSTYIQHIVTLMKEQPYCIDCDQIIAHILNPSTSNDLIESYKRNDHKEQQQWSGRWDALTIKMAQFKVSRNTMLAETLIEFIWKQLLNRQTNILILMNLKNVLSLMRGNYNDNILFLAQKLATFSKRIDSLLLISELEASNIPFDAESLNRVANTLVVPMKKLSQQDCTKLLKFYLSRLGLNNFNIEFEADSLGNTPADIIQKAKEIKTIGNALSIT